jgi:acetyl esterase/lipase
VKGLDSRTLRKSALAAGILCAIPLLAQTNAPGPVTGSPAISSGTVASPQPVPLWPNGAPGTTAANSHDIPTLTTYLPAQNPTHTGIIICPGGGYQMLAVQKEGTDVAHWLNARGVAAFVLQYRYGPANHFPIPLLDAQRAIRTVRAAASQEGIDPTHIGIWGFSAGGHLNGGDTFRSGKSAGRRSD